MGRGGIGMDNESLQILKRYWNYDSFRSLQPEIISSVLEGRDTLGLLPTGGGKSICFQVPALQKEGICIVISPLIALMKDQVDHLRSKEIQAIAIHSGMTKREIDIAFDNCIFGNIKFLYLSPERLYSDLARERLKHMKVSFIVVDEAHCISEWGFDFRPSYLQISILREIHSTVPVLALTATATDRVIKDIQEKLVFKKDHRLFVRSFKRENLAYMALYEENKMDRMLRVIRKVGGTGIVYVRNRRETKEIASWLLNNGIPAGFYHAGLDMRERNRTQQEWMQNKIRVIVATNAFGMGIDKPDVRFVIHLDIPDTLEAYFQEAGRAGRDQKKSFAVMLFTRADQENLKKSLVDSFPDYKYIQKIYHYLCNYYQIPYGAGIDQQFEFDILDFTKKYSLEAVPVLSAIKFMERDGWLASTEAVFIPSRFKFEIDFQELYKFQISSAKYDPLVKAILRTYGGVFDSFIPINEYEFARKLRISYQEVVELLKSLEKFEIASYLPSSDSPKIQFLRPRVDHKHLHVDMEFITARKRIKTEQLNAVFDYLKAKTCRSQVLLRYFGESESIVCGECDLCLVRMHRLKNLKMDIERQVKDILSKKHSDIHALVDKINVGDDSVKLEVIRELLDLGKIRRVDQLYSWADKS